MSENEELSSMEQLTAQHRKQRKELQAKIQSIKKSVPKGDRSRLKEVQKKITAMESELKAKQIEELEALHKQEAKAADNLATQIEEVKLDDKANKNQEVRVSKAQKKRERKAAKAKELSARLAQADEDYKTSARYLEEKRIKERLLKLGLVIKQIPSDGNCMYSAIRDQLVSPIHTGMSVDELRRKTAEYIRENKDDFLPFMTSKHAGDMLTPDEFDAYCEEILLPSTWGGQIELIALARVLHLSIHVIQADVDTTVHGEQSDSNPIILTYHKHELGLGEHYNSVTKPTAADDFELASKS